MPTCADNLSRLKNFYLKNITRACRKGITLESIVSMKKSCNIFFEIRKYREL